MNTRKAGSAGERRSRTTTNEKGRFQLRVSAERRGSVWVVAWKEGSSLGWQSMRSAEDGTDVAVRLDQPAVLAGLVVDESGAGIGEATVRLCLRNDWAEGSSGVSFAEPREWFTTRTDDRGRFRFERIPAGASADFWAEAPGRASCWTHWIGDLSAIAGCQFPAGRTDVRIVLRSEAILGGRVVDEESGRGVPGVRSSLVRTLDTRTTSVSPRSLPARTAPSSTGDWPPTTIPFRWWLPRIVRRIGPPGI